MKKGFLFVLVCFLMCSCSFNDDYNEGILMDILYYDRDEQLLFYSAVPESNKQMLWQEEFDNNDSKWPFDITKAHQIYDEYYPRYRTTATIENGYFSIISTMPIPLNRTFDIPVVFERNQNYEIELSIFGNINYDIFWNGNWEEHYYFNIISLFFDNANGYTANTHLDIVTREHKEKIRLWSNNTVIVSDLYYYKPREEFWFLNKFNTVTIRKINNKYAFFINQKFLYLTKSQDKCTLKTIKLWINNKGSKLDYARVQYIDD